MDSGVLMLLDEIEALRAEIKRIRIYAHKVVSASAADRLGMIRKLELELNRFAPSMGINKRKKE